MKDLIKITEHNGQQAVSARDLYEFLELSERFSKWFNRMSEYGFIEGVDYTPYQTVHPLNNQPLTNYVLSIDCAKEISMLQRSDKGKQARLYFIECERKLKNNVFKLPQSLPEALRLAADEAEKRQAAEKQLEMQKPLVTFAEALQISKHNILIGELAKILKQNGIEIGQNRLFEWLRTNKYLIKGGSQRNLPMQRSLELGLFMVKTTTINNPDGSVRVTRTTKVTPKGQKYFINKFIKNLKDREV